MNTTTVLIAMTASKGFFEGMIRKLTRSPYNHVMVLYKCPFWGGWWALQVDDHGVRPVPIENLTSKITRWKFFQYDKDVLPQIPLAKPDMNHDYDYLGIFGFLLKLITFRLTGIQIRNFIHKKNEMFCSEFTSRFFRRIRVPGADTLDPPSTSPGDLVKFCSEGHGFTEYSAGIVELML
jgi:hypothetical protein